jgi:hypothetical protein
MDSQLDHISKPSQSKIEPSEYVQAGDEKGEGNVRASLQVTGSDSRTDAAEVGRQGLPVVRDPKDLHLHPALLGLNGMDEAVEMNEAERVRHNATALILISSDGTVLSGIGHWRAALLHSEREVQCIEYEFGHEEALKFILVQYGPRRAWNPFVRARLALTLEPYFQRLSLDNMRNGGKHKGLARLPNPQRIDVRRQIAQIAGVGARSVGNVKAILAAAHSCLIIALTNGTLTINKALILCKFPRASQLEAFNQLIEERAVDEVIQHSLKRGRLLQPGPDSTSILTAFGLCELRHPGSVVVRRSTSGHTTISLPNELLDKITSQTGALHEKTGTNQRADHSDTSLLGPARDQNRGSFGIY